MAKQETPHCCPASQRGVALVTALITVVIVFLLIMSTLYVVTTSTMMSGAGKRYATACEAADGAVEIGKEEITAIWRDAGVHTILVPDVCIGTSPSYNLPSAVQNLAKPCTVSYTLPGTLGTRYNTNITIELLYLMGSPGQGMKFPPQALAGSSGQGLFYRITAVVFEPHANTTCENSALYRFKG